MVDLSKVLIIGSAGLIGSELDFGVKLSHKEIDVTSRESVREAIDKYKPDGVINLASVNIRDCVEKPFLGNEVNVIGTYNLAAETFKIGIPLVIISTGAIFNGTSEKKFSEEDLPNPVNIYGQTKYFAEILALSVNPKTLVLRTGWLFGFRKNKNFFNKLLESLQKNEKVKVTYDQYGSFTYVKDFIENMKKLILSKKEGIYHVVNSGSATAMDLANFLSEKINSESPIEKISIKDYEREGLKRSFSEVLISNKTNMRDWKSALADFIRINNLGDH